MKRAGIVLTVLFATVLSAAAETTVEPKPFDWYLEHYPFMNMRGKTFTIETEFTWPEGFHRIDSAQLNEFQFWVSHLPLWHHQRPVGLRYGAKYQPDEVARPVHLPWRTIRFYDYTIPVQLLLEYALYAGKLEDFTWVPIEGDTLQFDRFLESKAITYRGRELRFQEAEKRPRSVEEIDDFMNLCARWTDYASLEANCAEVTDGPLLPGDLFIARDSSGNDGMVYTVLGTITNDDGDYLHVVGTGCPESCDFHIPRFNDRRDNPWVSREDIEALGSAYPIRGCYRMPLP
ncbi:hypothetical protein GF420_13210 [candidate division GN15 bacterium]|nr:hypothetical protein [candidate division GN15 bacterium]